MDKYPEKLTEITYPEIRMGDSFVELRDKPFFWDIARCVIFFSFMIYSLLNKSADQPFFLILFLTLLFLYSLLHVASLNRIIVDFKSRKFIRKNTNPLTILFRTFLQIPNEIPFNNVKKIYDEETDNFNIVDTKHIVYIRTDDQYNLAIATFKKQQESMLFVKYLKCEFEKYK